ncbi:MAG: tetratricopeptide repeat protein, partial [Armatimonadota bacterium]
MDSTHTLEGAMAQARAALETNQFVRVCELLESYRSQAWDNSQFLILYGVALCNSGHAQEALEVLERSVEVTPTATTHYNLGQCHQMLGDLNNAKLCYVQAVAHSPGHIKANNALQEIRGMTLAEDRGATRLLTEPQALQESVIPSSVIPPLPPLQSPSDRYFDPTASAEPPKPKGSRTPEQIAMDEADKLEEWDRIRREYVTNGVKYGAICGAILFAVVVLVFSFLGSTMAMISGG